MKTEAPDKATEEKATGFGTEPGLRELIRTDERWAIGALMRLYQFQTMDEQIDHTTRHQNAVGFNGTDAEILSSFAEQYNRIGSLSDKQILFMKGKLQKYTSQLLRHGNVVPLENHKKQRQTRRQYKRARLEENEIIIEFSYDKQLVNLIKQLPGRRWNPHNKTWTAPFCLDSVEKLDAWAFDMDPKLVKAYQKLASPHGVAIGPIPGLQKELFPFQKDGVAFLESREGRAVIGDEMGLGKTVQALAWLQLHPELRPAVVVVPASVKINWTKEARTWMNYPEIEALWGRTPNTPLINNKIYVINYDILTAWVHFLKELPPKVVILDECHYIKNRQTQRTRATKQLCLKVPHVIALSGTPIVNRPVEFFNTLHIVRPEIFPSFWKYAMKYCGAQHNGFGWDFTGATNTKELHETLTKTVMIRRLKADVLRELPPKIRSVVPLELSTSYQKEYAQAHRDFLGWIEKVDPEKLGAAERAEALVRIEKLKQLCVEGKIANCVEWIHDYMEGGDKLVVFCTHHYTIDRLSKELKKFNPVKVDGRIALNHRQQSIDTFQTQPSCRVFLGNIKAAGVGINLTAANATCFVELGWTPGEHSQAEDRIHRIGQQSDSVMAYYLISCDTIEEEISVLLDKKRAVLSSVLDGRNVTESDMLSELLRKYKS